MSIKKEVLIFAYPIIINLLLGSIITVTDIFVVSKFGADAISGVGIAQNVLGLVFAISLIFSSGGKVLLTRFYGAKNYKKASLVISTLLVSALILSLILMIVIFILLKVILAFLNVSIEVAYFANIFNNIMLLNIVFMILVTVLDTMLVSKGDSKTPMYLAALSAIVNVVLDLLLGIGCCKFKGYGVAGVAVSTLISYIINCAILLYIYFKRQKVFIPSFRFNFKIFKRVFKVAFPEASARVINNLSNLLYGSLIVILGSVGRGLSIAFNFKSFT